MNLSLIEKFVESKSRDKNVPVSISFRKRTAMIGLFVEWKDYKEMKTKNFWRIIPESKIAEWEKTNDIQLARLFSGNDFTRLK